MSTTGLDLGYRQLYNLQFDAAHQTFQAWIRSHPADPLGPASDAVAYLFAEMDRLHILQAQFFSNDHDFLSGPEGATNPGFYRDLDQSEALAGKLAGVPAMYAQALCHGLRADDDAIIHKRYLASLGEMKKGRLVAERLLALDPGYADAYLAVGIENYILGLKPAPVRWLLRLDGASTDKAAGLKQLQVTAQSGHYLRPYAQILLAIAALRDRQPDTARALLAQLAEQFPANPLYAQELARLGEVEATVDLAHSSVHFTLGAFLHTVHGTFSLTGGALRWDPASGAANGAVVVAAASGDSGNADRDRDMRTKVLDSAAYPEITFTPVRVAGNLARSGKSDLVVHGTLTLHGADHPLDLPLQVDVAGDRFTATGRLTIPYVAWGLKDPSNLVLHVAKTVELQLRAAGTVRWPGQ